MGVLHSRGVFGRCSRVEVVPPTGELEEGEGFVAGVTSNLQTLFRHGLFVHPTLLLATLVASAISQFAAAIAREGTDNNEEPLGLWRLSFSYCFIVKSIPCVYSGPIQDILTIKISQCTVLSFFFYLLRNMLLMHIFKQHLF